MNSHGITSTHIDPTVINQLPDRLNEWQGARSFVLKFGHMSSVHYVRLAAGALYKSNFEVYAELEAHPVCNTARPYPVFQFEMRQSECADTA